VARLMETSNKCRILENVCFEYKTKLKIALTYVGILGEKL
jgi:hypothetical protein